MTEADGGEVNVYFHRHYDTDRQLLQQFTEKTGVAVDVVVTGADDLIQRLLAEGEQTDADLLTTADAARLHRAKEEGLLQPVESEVISDRLRGHHRVAIAPDTEVLSGESAVPCHRDFSPRNRLVDETPDGLSWSLIRFERARLDQRYADFEFMWPNHWKGRPDRRGAFFAGYDRELSADEETRLRFTVLINCLGTISWARENDDPAFGRWAIGTIEDLYHAW